jgi:hypothetical protein
MADAPRKRGRPPKAGKAMEPAVYVRFDKATRKAVERAQADDHHLSLSDAVRALVVEALRARKLLD